MQDEQLSIGFRTDIGRQRNANEDSYAVLTRADLGGGLDALVVVADGMGGVGGGEIASGIVANTVPETVRLRLAERNGSGSRGPTDILRDAIEEANSRVRERRMQSDDLRRMGTTCVAAIVVGDELTVGHVGDSRAYLLRDGVMRQLTDDHSEVWQEVLAGNLTPEQARHSRYRNVITRAVGIGAHVEADIRSLALRSGDTVLICSDGLTTEVEDGEIAGILAFSPDAQAVADRLVQTALANGGSDNITVAVLRYGAFQPASAAEDDDEITDRNQAWKARNWPSSDEQPAAPLAPATVAILPGWAPIVLGLLILAVLAEAAGIYWLYAHRLYAHRPAQAAAAANPPAAPPPRATDGPLVYGRPQMVINRPLQDGYLLLEENGQAVVVAPDGTKLRVTPDGRVRAIPGLTLPPAAQRSRVGAIYLATDESGNLFQTNPSAGAIEKYARSGARVSGSIGMGHLSAPGALAVAPDGDVFVIDNHRLKRIPAHPELSQRPVSDR